MTIYEYIKKYGKYTFSEEKFNEVDAIIFSFLSYANYKKIFNNKKTITIHQASRMFTGVHYSKEDNVIAGKEGYILIKELNETKRYSNCKLFNYEYEGNNDLQFGALSIEYEPGKVFISFEGTNDLISGWKEDLKLSYEFPTISHKKAIDYLNKHYTFSTKDLIIGGHSKGGNLALVSGMYSNILVRLKIKKIYGIDSPGLLKEVLKSHYYYRIEDRYYHYIPEYSLVGILLHSKKDIVIRSNEKGINGHSLLNWPIDENKFIRTNLSKISIKLREDINNWSDTNSKEDKIELVTNLEKVLNKVQVDSLIDIRDEKTKIFDIIIESKDISKKCKKTLIDFISMIIKDIGNNKKEEIKNIINDSIMKIKEKIDIK